MGARNLFRKFTKKFVEPMNLDAEIEKITILVISGFGIDHFLS